ncbi:MAG TPA: MerR family transcriptional regulator [Anaerolineae bacterium]|nr:MerR family transcriptional regulator [Anaerolineae bacterium]HOQ98158.1 MerR family transcriptional regulator [Anaerolineae bacterium]HPL27784.1 MerR family transcriptional regulator [Anaerolineae bacterium]
MEEHEIELTIEELAEQVAVPVRTVRYYISEGLLPGPGGRGKAASYGEEHLLRLRLVRLLAEQRVPLAEIRARLVPLSLGEVRALLAGEGRLAEERKRAAGQPSPRAYVEALLQQARGARYGDAMPARAAEVAERRPPSGTACYCLDAPSAEPWQRWALAPGVELHVRTDAATRERELVERLLRAAGRGSPSDD